MTFGRQLKVKEGKAPRVKFEKVFADHFMALYDKTKNKDFDEETLRNFCNKGRKIHEIR